MTATIIITLCVLVILAYVFDITAAHTKIPTVILLLLLGWVARQVLDILTLEIPDLSAVLPILGTIGLILIVLEGSLELELRKEKLPFIGKTALIATLPVFFISFLLAFVYQTIYATPFKIALANAIPLAVISSAIAIPTAHRLPAPQREFITYESSLSDIVGVIFFNFVVYNEVFSAGTFVQFGGQLLLLLGITLVATLGLAYLMSQLTHSVKFLPIIITLILIYTLAKVYHLPSLLFILLFGLFIGNLDEFKHHAWIQRLHPEQLGVEVHKFKELTAEFTFLIRIAFFLVFGFQIQTAALLDAATLMSAVGIVALIFGSRWLLLRLFKVPFMPVGFIAPRGLITILLFLSLPVSQQLPYINNSLLIQVILLCALVMMVGSFLQRKKEVVAHEGAVEGAAGV